MDIGTPLVRGIVSGEHVGLTAQDLGSVTRLSQLAANPHAAQRGEIYLAVASLYQTQAPRLSERERSLMREILQRLAGDVEMTIRIALAEKLADDEAAPLDLILLLADDSIEVARPVILRSQRLGDTELLSLLEHAGESHQTACAERPNIGAPVCDVLAKSNSETVLVALVRNATAQIAAGTFETLVEKSRRIAALQHPLADRQDLPLRLATQMCGWVTDALKAHIRVRHPDVAASVALKLTEAESRMHAAPQPSAAEPAAGAVKLVDKLAAAGQLRAGFLLRVLHQGQIDLFDIAFAKLLGLELSHLRHVLYEQGPRPVALACRAVGIDRCVFPTVFNLSRQTRGQHPALTAQDKAEVGSVFQSLSKPEALAQLRGLTQST
jgi:uncharacterized protein (DUF2336 family)